MTIRHAVWKIAAKPEALEAGSLVSESELEDMIVAEPSILSDQWMLIGRQIPTPFGGIIDLLAIAPDGSLVVIELKRNRTPREVVAQAIDYASYVDGMKSEDIAQAYSRRKASRDLAADFQTRFGQPLDEDALNESHQIVVVASYIDDSTERIVRYLNDRDIAINILCFRVFSLGAERLLSRAWVVDLAQTQANVTKSSRGEKEPWNGEIYASFGEGPDRSWEDARKYGFICAGGGTWYSNTLNLLNIGDRIWVKAPGFGFVGVGRVKGPSQAATDFRIATPEGEREALSVLTGRNYHRQYAGDPEKCEYFVPVDWLHTLPLEQGIKEVGMFGNQNTVCKPTTPKWRTTVERLKTRFPGLDH